MLVLQPYLVELESLLVVGCIGAVLVSASAIVTIDGMVEGSYGGDQVCQQTSDLAERERNEAVLVGFNAPFLPWAAVTARWAWRTERTHCCPSTS